MKNRFISVFASKVFPILLLVFTASTSKGFGQTGDSNSPDRKVLALLIGNSDYVNVPQLKNGENDARLLQQTFQEIGVDSVMASFNLTRKEMNSMVGTFIEKMKGFDVGVVYFAGHGMQDEYGENYLVPVDFGNQGTVNDLFSDAYPLDRLIRGCQRMKENAFLFLIDACRNNPYASSSRSSSGGLSVPSIPAEGLLIGYSTSSGKVAGDFPNQQNGLYAMALRKNLLQPNLKVEDVLKKVGSEVRRSSEVGQSPDWWGNLQGDIYLNYSAKEFNVKVSSEQDRLISDWISLNDTVDIYLKLNQGDFAFLRGVIDFSSSSLFQSFVKLNNRAGQSSSAREAALFALDIETIEIYMGESGLFDASARLDKYEYEELLDLDAATLFEEQHRFCNYKKFKNPDDLQVYLCFALMTSRPNHSRIMEIYRRVLEFSEQVDQIEIRMGARHTVANQMQQKGYSSFAFNFPIQIEEDTIRNVANGAGVSSYQYLREGDWVAGIYCETDTLESVPQFYDQAIEIEIQRHDALERYKLDPLSGFLFPNGQFIASLNKIEQLRSDFQYVDAIMSAQEEEANYLFFPTATADGGAKKTDLARVLPTWANYVTINNMLNDVNDVLTQPWETFSGGCSHWENYVDDFSLFQRASLSISINAYKSMASPDMQYYAAEILALNGLSTSLNSFASQPRTHFEAHSKKEQKEREALLSEMCLILKQVISKVESIGFTALYGKYLSGLSAAGYEDLHMASLIWRLGNAVERHRYFYGISSENFVPLYEPLEREIDFSDFYSQPTWYLTDYLNYSYVVALNISDEKEEAEFLKEVLHELLYELGMFSFDDMPDNLIDNPLWGYIYYYSDYSDFNPDTDVEPYLEVIDLYSQFVSKHLAGYWLPTGDILAIIEEIDSSNIELTDSQKRNLSASLQTAATGYFSNLSNISPFHRPTADFTQFTGEQSKFNRITTALMHLTGLEKESDLYAELEWLSGLNRRFSEMEALWSKKQN